MNDANRRKAVVCAVPRPRFTSPRRLRRFPLRRRRADPPFRADDGEGVDAGDVVKGRHAGVCGAPRAASRAMTRSGSTRQACRMTCLSSLNRSS